MLIEMPDRNKLYSLIYDNTPGDEGEITGVTSVLMEHLESRQVQIDVEKLAKKCAAIAISIPAVLPERRWEHAEDKLRSAIREAIGEGE